ncbi:MAG: hypothetical protein P4L79_10580 [Legionella sp.]|uniref:hypothetical protein n=1 Tax=Legionella sp. TaxID=459 RepID=UPI00284DC7E2|nr:hypothetical protein [Legionella sp.]
MIIYIHGANESPSSFNFIRKQLGEHEYIDFEYSYLSPLQKIIDRFVEEIKNVEETKQVISHSLGGIIALAARDKINFEKVVTLSTPFGGSKSALLMSWFMPPSVMDDVATNSKIILGLKNNPIDIPVLSYVTTGGNMYGFFAEENDDVVTVASQMALEGPEYVKIKMNHFGVLQSKRVVSGIKKFLER